MQVMNIEYNSLQSSARYQCILCYFAICKWNRTNIVVMSDHNSKCPNTLVFVQTLCQDSHELYFQAVLFCFLSVRDACSVELDSISNSFYNWLVELVNFSGVQGKVSRRGFLHLDCKLSIFTGWFHGGEGGASSSSFVKRQGMDDNKH